MIMAVFAFSPSLVSASLPCPLSTQLHVAGGASSSRALLLFFSKKEKSIISLEKMPYLLIFFVTIPK